MRSWVSVPVLSVQRMSMAPKFWMEFRRLTIAFFFDIAKAPFERLTVTIMGSISGVRPTAIDSAKRKASAHGCPLCLLVRPMIRKTAATMTIMNLIMSQVKSLIPLSKLVKTRRPASFSEIDPK